MIGTYASAALICAASLLVGRVLLSFAGRDSWSWLEPAVGFGAMITVARLLCAQRRGTGPARRLALVALIVPRRRRLRLRTRPNRRSGAIGEGWRRCDSWFLALSIPFAVSGRWGLLGEGFNNDLGLHLAWAEWLRSGFGPDARCRLPARPPWPRRRRRRAARHRPGAGLHR